MCDKEELGILSCMYDGDKNRDASDKIRGFIFQDYVAIMSLLEEDVECVCLEYLEDVDVILKMVNLELFRLNIIRIQIHQLKIFQQIFIINSFVLKC